MVSFPLLELDKIHIDFTYNNKTVTDLIKRHLEEANFTGVSVHAKKLFLRYNIYLKTVFFKIGSSLF